MVLGLAGEGNVVEEVQEDSWRCLGSTEGSQGRFEEGERERESYGNALVWHEEKLGRVDSEKVKKWKQALIEASHLSGWH